MKYLPMVFSSALSAPLYVIKSYSCDNLQSSLLIFNPRVGSKRLRQHIFRTIFFKW